MATSESNLTRSLMYLFEMLVTDAVPTEKAAKENKALKIWIVVSHINNLMFVHSCRDI